MVGCLAPGGRLAVITFQSLEDGIAKKTFAQLHDPCTCPKSAPVCICGKKPMVRLITKKPLTAKEEELNENPRAKSAKLRPWESSDRRNRGAPGRARPQKQAVTPDRTGGRDMSEPKVLLNQYVYYTPTANAYKYDEPERAAKKEEIARPEAKRMQSRSSELRQWRASPWPRC